MENWKTWQPKKVLIRKEALNIVTEIIFEIRSYFVSNYALDIYVKYNHLKEKRFLKGICYLELDEAKEKADEIWKDIKECKLEIVRIENTQFELRERVNYDKGN